MPLSEVSAAARRCSADAGVGVCPTLRCAALPLCSAARFSTMSVLWPSISSSGASVMRWRRAGSATAFTSSGVTKSRPSMSGVGAGGAHQRDPAARAGAGGHAGPRARGAGDPHGVVGHALVHGERGDEALQRQHALRLTMVPTLSTLSRSPTWLAVTCRTIACSSSGRKVDADLEQEAVELRLGQRVGAFLLDRVLRGEHHERRLAAGAACPRW